ncbi:hypothetical protein GGH94_001714 [Coemansia aciculifera]|uniref:HSF-type DNA-binding domain-containing protein n=1 Tax=Coemansia aciculifera TaxID=417176 RepID=A0A9W8M7W5_9FUNG|nr:hypothetical protein GGH94_001714 [Coemansia aciculifera]
MPCILSDACFACLRWSPDGLSVVIDGSEEVGNQVLSQYFQTEKISSFIRQFHLYGFKRTTDGRKNKDKRGYSKWEHRYFQRGRYDYLELITRVPPPKSPLKDKSEYKSGAYMSRLRLPMTDPRTPSTYSSLSVGVQPTNLVPGNQGMATSPVIVAYSQQPALTAVSSPSPTLSAVVDPPLSPLAPPPPLPVAAEISTDQQMLDLLRQQNPHIQSVFQTPRALEVMYALQTLEDNLDHVHTEAPLITTPDNMSHLLAHQGVQPQDHQEYIGNAALGPKMSPLTPFPTDANSMFSASHTQQLGGAPVTMTTEMFSAASKATSFHVTAARSNIGDIEMAYSPRATDMPQHLGGFSVADIYLPQTSPFGSCPRILDATVGTPMPLFMNVDSFSANPPPPLAPTDSWTTSMSDSTAMDLSTSTSEQSHNITPGFQHRPLM